MSQCLKLPVLTLLLDNFLRVMGIRGLQLLQHLSLLDMHAKPIKMSRITNTAVTVMIKLLLLRAVLGPLESTKLILSKIGSSRSIMETSTVQAGIEVVVGATEDVAAAVVVVVVLVVVSSVSPLSSLASLLTVLGVVDKVKAALSSLLFMSAYAC